jgi:hypothetical protein
MVDKRLLQILDEQLKLPPNQYCADCGVKGVI